MIDMQTVWKSSRLFLPDLFCGTAVPVPYTSFVFEPIGDNAMVSRKILAWVSHCSWLWMWDTTWPRYISILAVWWIFPVLLRFAGLQPSLELQSCFLFKWEFVFERYAGVLGVLYVCRHAPYRMYYDPYCQTPRQLAHELKHTYVYMMLKFLTESDTENFSSHTKPMADSDKDKADFFVWN